MNNIVYPIEIRKTKSPNKSMIKNFSILNKGEKEIGEGGIICIVDKILPLDNKNIAIPIQCISLHVKVVQMTYICHLYYFV